MRNGKRGLIRRKGIEWKFVFKGKFWTTVPKEKSAQWYQHLQFRCILCTIFRPLIYMIGKTDTRTAFPLKLIELTCWQLSYERNFFKQITRQSVCRTYTKWILYNELDGAQSDCQPLCGHEETTAVRVGIQQPCYEGERALYHINLCCKHVVEPLQGDWSMQPMDQAKGHHSSQQKEQLEWWCRG